MPTYEYACKQCGHRVEVVQPMSDEPLKTCGVCGGELRKVFHPAGLLFKGSGFYATDNRAKDTGDAPEKPEKPEKKAEKTDDRKADAPSSSPRPSKKDDGSIPPSSSAKDSGGEGGSSGGSSPATKEESA